MSWLASVFDSALKKWVGGLLVLALTGITLYIWSYRNVVMKDVIVKPVTEIHEDLAHSVEEAEHQKKIYAEVLEKGLNPVLQRLDRQDAKQAEAEKFSKTDHGLVSISVLGDTPYFQPNRQQSRTGRLYKEGDKLCLSAFVDNVEVGATCSVVVQGSHASEKYKGRISKIAAEHLNVPNLPEVYIRIEPES